MRAEDAVATRKRRKIGQGMTPLFDVEAHAATSTTPALADAGGGRTSTGRGTGTSTAAPATPVPYWVRGVFRFGNGEEHTHTVDGVGMSNRLPDDAARFVAYLRESGWLFPQGRATLIEVLGIAAHHGGLILLGEHTE
jgi:hypothetical protein